MNTDPKAHMTNETPDPDLTNPTPGRQPIQSPSPGEACAALQQADAARIASSADNSVHARVTAAFGVLIGTYFALTRVDALADRAVLTSVGYVVIAAALTAWQARAARLVPRGARRISVVALAVTLVVIMVVLGVVNSVFRQQPQPALALVGAGLAVAAPLLVAGVLIRRAAR